MHSTLSHLEETKTVDTHKSFTDSLTRSLYSVLRLVKYDLEEDLIRPGGSGSVVFGGGVFVEHRELALGLYRVLVVCSMRDCDLSCMETLVAAAAAEHRNHGYYGRVGKPNRSGVRCGASPSRHFREINCRTFQSGAGLLPTPFKSCSTPVAKRPLSSSSPKTPSPACKYPSISHSVDSSHFKIASKSSPIPISGKAPRKERAASEELGALSRSLPFSERWAGPAYSNSPPPSSLPIPKFSMRPKRTVSLDLPLKDDDDTGVILQPNSKSAPASPTREHTPVAKELFLSADFATKTLRRILNLDVADE
ncbi:hypothetical protein Tsubulata_034374 [Turnera subulata]|uniref:Uncharacterized protein n=1 Tax=Turnera subulata TaxID=218843 RepID=A0A9Q0GAR2_9ROSI|nr:hypothetical protein Tsubulata_034374 [Turnera subulata]